MERMYRFLLGLSKTLMFIVASFSLVFGFTTETFKNSIDIGFIAEKNATEDYSVYINSDYALSYEFFMYEQDSLSSEKLAYQKPQTVRVLDVGEGKWIYAETRMGKGWINADSKDIYIEHFINSYKSARKSGEEVLLPPGVYPVVTHGEGDWYLTSTEYGDRWVELSSLPLSLELEAPAYDQLDGYKSACESFAATIALNVCGVDVEPAEFVTYVPQNRTKRHTSNGKLIWGDPSEEFVGSMNGGGYSAYPVVIEKAVNDNFGNYVDAEDITGAGFGDIVRHVSAGEPVLIWFHPSGKEVSTPYVWETPAGKVINADYGTHTVAITGYNLSKGTVVFNDSLGAVRRELEWSFIEKTYSYTGSKALVIRKLEAVQDKTLEANNR